MYVLEFMFVTPVHLLLLLFVVFFTLSSDTPELISSTTKQTSLSMSECVVKLFLLFFAIFTFPHVSDDLNAPQINFSVVSLQKIPGHIKRKLQDQVGGW